MKKTLILTGKEAARLLTMKEALAAVEDAFRSYGRGRVIMPAKIYLHLEKYRGDFRAMPAYIEGMEASGLKWVNVHPGNRRLGLPVVMAVMIYSDPATGFPLAIMDGTAITSMRTGAAGGIAAKYLARKDSRAVALIGCGAQAGTQLEALRENFRINQAAIWSRDPDCAGRFIRAMKGTGIRFEIKKTVKECVQGADIVVTTTPSRKPLVKSGWIRPGTHINAIGADAKGKEELDPELLGRSKIVIDDWAQASHSGEINVPLAKGIISKKDIYASIGEIIIGKKRGRTGAAEITVFDSTGLAIQDIAVARLIYTKALKKKTGRFMGIIA